MTTLECAELIRLQAEELVNDIRIREKAMQEYQVRYPVSGHHVTPQQSRESIKRKITHLRQSLLTLKERM